MILPRCTAAKNRNKTTWPHSHGHVTAIHDFALPESQENGIGG